MKKYDYNAEQWRVQCSHIGQITKVPVMLQDRQFIIPWSVTMYALLLQPTHSVATDHPLIKLK